MSDPVTSAGSPIESGSRSGTAPTAPDSYTSTSRGAWVRRARLQARLGSPMPTKTTSPSRSSRAAATAIISPDEWPVGARSPGVDASPASVPIAHPGADAGSRGKPLDERRLLLEVRAAVRHAVHELVEIRAQRPLVARDRLPPHVELVVPIVMPLRVRWVRPPRLDDHRAHDHPGDERAARVAAHDLLVDQLLDDDDDAPRGD